MDMHKFGLIGKNISYSFSKTHFSKKFENENILDCSYENFDIQDISEFQRDIKKIKALKGLNVTIPYKEAIIPYLDKLNKKAKAIGAVNTIKITKKGKFVGHNTDCYGFKKSIEPYLKPHHKKALILGTGGASKAIAYTFKKLDIQVVFVSRSPSKSNQYSYKNLTKEIVSDYSIIVNCSPLGTYPNVSECPDIPYDFLSESHLLFDLIYNPTETEFLRRGRIQGATTCNGSKMLYFQAEKAWKIWN